MLTASCNDDGGDPTDPGTRPDLPNAYRFFLLKSTGGSVPGRTIKQFRLDTTIDPRGDVIYGVVDNTNEVGLYGVRLDLSRSTPTILSERVVARTGDLLSDGRRILELHAYDVNAEGGLGIVLKVGTGELVEGGREFGKQVVFFGQQEQNLLPVLFDGFTTGDGHVLSGRYGDIDTHSSHDVLIVADYYHNETVPSILVGGAPHDVSRPLQGLFMLPGASTAQMRLVANTEDHIVDGDPISGFGLIDMHDGGNFVAQAHPATPRDASPSAQGGSGATRTVGASIVQGNVARRTTVMATAARPSPRSALTGVPIGDSFYGPRIGADNQSAYVLHTSALSMVLYYHGRRIVETGERSPEGNVVTSMTPPVFGPDGEIYFVLVTHQGHELYAANGEGTVLLLSTGDRLANDPRQIERMWFGQTTEHVDPDGRIVLIVGFAGGATGLTIGIPE